MSAAPADVDRIADLLARVVDLIDTTGLPERHAEIEEHTSQAGTLAFLLHRAADKARIEMAS